jgi:putative endopeptidase
MAIAAALIAALAVTASSATDDINGAAAAKPAVGQFGFDTSGMDRGVPPGVDFYRYANGHWDQRTVIPADRSNVGTIEALEDLSRSRVRAILEEAGHDAGSRSGIAFATFLDEAAIDRRGLQPIAAWLADLRAVDSPRAYTSAAALAGRRGVALPLDFTVEPDDAHPDRYALTISQPVLGMPDRDYYLSDKADMQRARAAYATYLGDILRAVGIADAENQAKAVLALETRMARMSWDAQTSRDATRTYNPSTLAELDKGRTRFLLGDLVRQLGYRTGRVIVRQPDAMAGILRLVDDESVATLRAMLVVRTMHRYAEVLPRNIRDADFAFYGKVLGGVSEPEPRWRQAVAFVLEAMPDDVSKVYVARYFSPATKASAKAMVDNLVAAFDKRIDKLDWMTPATRARAHRKLAAFVPKIGYPDRWHDYAGLSMVTGDAFGNALRANMQHHDWEVAKVDRPVYRWEWRTTPMTVDAFANFPTIEIIFPAAILQPPFFDPNADPAFNYGGIGASIAHEMTHHFDDQGSKYDESGKLAAWWSPADRAAFETRTQALADQFDRYEPLPGIKVNGKLTLGENMADLGGLTIAHDAYRASLKGKAAPTLEGFTGDQRFFLGWAQIWRLKYRDADLRRRLLSNPHAPAPQRVWTVRNLDAWAEAYDVKPDQPLYLPPEQRVHVW